MAFTLRPAAAGDAEFVLALFAREHVRRFTHGPADAGDYLRALERKTSLNLIVERDGAAFGNVILDAPQDWLAELRVIAVWESGSGAGRFAMQYALYEAFVARGVHRLYLEVVASNERARRLYESLGLRAEGLFRRGYRDDDGTFHDLVPYAMLRDEYAGVR